MKILREGMPPKKYPWMGVWTCPHCDGVFELEEVDGATLNPRWQEDQREGPSVKMHCPSCETMRTLWPYTGEAL